MTTIAWDGRTLAADRQATTGSQRGHMTKIVQLSKTRYAAGAGDVVEISQVMAWLKGGRRGKKPEIEDACFFVLDTRKKVCHVMDSRLVPIECNVPAAIGSGSDFAMGAMAAGKNAVEAVEIAARLDVFTGEGCDSIEITTKGTK